ncbi:hypothetical protein GY45DRAFT_1331923 [Cubamyces sp. BRFM 1775]|nr:hypothetical protein GY45DRAFT_1331923 [Cubamyces sp. BRFM 1775]
MLEPHKLRKAPPASAPAHRMTNPAQRQAPKESRTMSLARSLVAGSAHSPAQTTRPLEEPIVRGHDGPNRVWTYTSTVLSPTGRNVGQHPRTGNAHRTYNAEPSAIHVNAAERPHAGPVYYISLLQQCVASPANVITRSVTAVEHYWALRATRAETMAAAQTNQQREMSALAASWDEKRARDLAELNARFSHQFAMHEKMMWMILGTLISVVAALIYLLVRSCAPAASSSRWLPPLHFTIPILSPFASVVEQETSAVNVPLVALLLLGGGSFAFLWFRCGLRR